MKLRAALHLIARYWQPVAVVVGAVTAVAGTSVTVWRLSCWLTPELGGAPAATVAGVLSTAAALRWARLTVAEETEL